jgi:hypothetical protein
MKHLVANLFALIGGVWTSLCGILFLGLLWSIAEDPSSLSGPDRSYLVTPMAWTAVLLVAGIAVFSSGLRLMKNR